MKILSYEDGDSPQMFIDTDYFKVMQATIRPGGNKTIWFDVHYKNKADNKTDIVQFQMANSDRRQIFDIMHHIMNDIVI